MLFQSRRQVAIVRLPRAWPTTRTVLIITHRPQALTGCDRVLRVADGSIAAEAA